MRKHDNEKSEIGTIRSKLISNSSEILLVIKNIKLKNTTPQS
jgi:hypothetical protein